MHNHNPIKALMEASFRLDLHPLLFRPSARLPLGFSTHPFDVLDGDRHLLSVAPVGDAIDGPIGGDGPGSGEHWIALVMSGFARGQTFTLRPSDDADVWATQALARADAKAKSA